MEDSNDVLTRLRVRNFKRFDEVDIELGKAVVLIGPNNSGKTTALQALALGVRRGMKSERQMIAGEATQALLSTGAISLPSQCRMLISFGVGVRDVERVEKNGKPSTKTQNVGPVDIILLTV